MSQDIGVVSVNCSLVISCGLFVFIIQRPPGMVNTGGLYKGVIFFSYFPHESPSTPDRKIGFQNNSIRIEFLKSKIFLVSQYGHIIHVFEDEAL